MERTPYICPYYSGFGKRSLQGKILEEVEALIDVIKQEKGRAFNVSDYLHTSISNVICSVALGERFEHTDIKFRDITHAVTENLNNADVTGLLTFLPFLKYVPGDPVNYKGVMSNVDKIIESLKNLVEDHQRDFGNREATNYLDAYLDYQQGHKDVHGRLWLICSVLRATKFAVLKLIKIVNFVGLLHHPFWL